jgi:hypothetical protein
MNKNQAQKIRDIAQGFASAESQTEPTSKPIGRPKVGKSSNPDFKAFTVYLRIKTHTDIHRLQLDTNDSRDFSQIAQIALDEWLERQKAKSSAD